MKRVWISLIALFLIGALSGKSIAAVEAPTLSYTLDGVNLSVSWTPVPGATGYTFHYAPSTDTEPETFTEIDMGNLTTLSADLWEGAAYFMAVSAQVGAEESGYSNIESLTIPTVIPPSSPVLNLITDNLTLNATWSDVSNATSYTLFYAPYPYEGPETIGSIEMGSETSFGIDLWDGAAYYIAVSANNEKGSSDYSNIELFFCYSEENAPKGMLTYSDKPALGEELSITFDVDKDLYETVWELTSKPENSEASLNISEDLKTVSLVPDQIGDYELSVSSKPDGFEQTTNFTIRPIFSYDENKIEGNDGSTPLNEMIAVIKNQSWVYAPSLSEAEIRVIVSKYSDLIILGYDDIQGLLIEYDEDSIQQTGALEALKQESSISSVLNRVYEGEDSRSTGAIPPNDGSSFYDGGENWHLEFTDALSAWEITTGNSDISVGVTDAGYDANHYELSGRVSTLLSTKTDNHGNGVAGTIGALTDNGSGMSGVNWTSQLLLGDWTPDHIISILNSSKSRVSNQSWTFTLANSSFDPNDPLSASQRKADMIDITRYYRKLIINYPDKIMVWAVGNGLGNGAGYNGIYGIDGSYAMPALHFDDNGNLDKLNNLITVAAMADESRLTYYSNYGESVDIAAPSHFKSLTTNQGFQNFTGTSAASPVVTGITSLIYSLYPDFSGKEVKDILIDSATDYVYERYVSPSNTNTEALAHPLPILNAGNALAMAEEIYSFNYEDFDKDGFTLSQGDCDDNDRQRFPGNTEICGDGIDQDCNNSDCEVTPPDIIADPNLRACIEELNKPFSDITSLDCAGDITSLQGIDNLTNLNFVTLWAWGQGLSDISPLQNLNNLEKLDFSGSRLLDISPLANLHSLKWLKLANTQIADIPPLQNLVNLEFLDLSFNQISNISPLQNLVNLNRLFLRDNQISDISPLQNLVNIKDLRIRNNMIEDISILTNFIDIEVLDVVNNCVSDFSPIEHFSNYNNPNQPYSYYLLPQGACATTIPTSLTLSGVTEMDENTTTQLTASVTWSDGSTTNETESVSWDTEDLPVPDANGFVTAGEVNADTQETLWAQFTAEGVTVSDEHTITIVDVSAPAPVIADANLRACVDALGLPYSEISSLDCSASSINNIVGIENLSNLSVLKLGSNSISDISPLQRLVNLDTLSLYRNQISDISPLRGLVNLTYLDLWRNQISDISPLQGLVNLTHLLSLPGNQISDISPLQGLVNLTGLDLWGNQISDISPLQGLVNLTGLSLNYNQVSDISPLQGLVNLTRLNLDNNQISDISPLQNLSRLMHLDIQENCISDFTPIEGLPNYGSSTFFLTPQGACATVIPISLTISGVTEMNENTTTQLTVMVTWSNGSATNETANTSWDIENLSIPDVNGHVSAGEVNADKQETVWAQFTAEGVTVSDEHTITVLDVPALEPVSLTISGPTEIDEGSTIQVSANVLWSDGSTTNEIANLDYWEWGATGALMDYPNTSGFVTAAEVDSDTQEILEAVFSSNGVEVRDDYIITVLDSAPASIYTLTAGCDDQCDVYINSNYVGASLYGGALLEEDISDLIVPGNNELRVIASDNQNGSCWSANVKVYKDDSLIGDILETYCEVGCSPCGNPVLDKTILFTE